MDLVIDVFELKAQQARVLDNLRPPDLVKAVLTEFQELDYLGKSPAEYRLLRADTNAALDETEPLGAQLLRNDHLVLAERSQPTPSGAQRPEQNLYLRDVASNTVYKLHWLPAIIGRWDETQPNNNLLAVNLDAHAAGPRVSRRHAQIVYDEGSYWVESLSSNATSIVRNGIVHNGDEPTPVNVERQPLQPGDVIRLERSEIGLKFIVRGA
ncbi:MAG: FHA domain-containing protein [Caldilineaceae bacterium]